MIFFGRYTHLCLVAEFIFQSGLGDGFLDVFGIQYTL